ncbi:MAG: beta-lactamase family protein [Gemmatimonadales bacterium]|nr:beta-lactamase family protein [Gemmatimonadales bacterium]
MRRSFGLILLALTPTLIGAQSSPRPDRWQPVREAANRLVVERGVAAVAVAVAKDGKIVWEEGFGWANREKLIPATEHTMFSLASISKPITATGLMLLVDRGQVDLDRPANDYLGFGKITGLAGDASGATVRRILAHTSGLPLHYQFFYDNEATRRRPSMDETVGRYGILVSAPGETFQYSNLGYGILDDIISRVSGRTYADFMRNEVFLPLGLTRTSIDIAPGLEPYVAERYWRGKPVPFYTFDHPGGSAVYSSAHDLVRFGMFHLKNKLAEQRAILPASRIDEMQRPETPAFGSHYSLGWVVGQDRGHRLVQHSGGMPGVSTILHLYPEANAVIVVLTNASAAPFGDVLSEAAAVILPGYADSLKAERARPRPTPAPAAFAPPAELVGTWTGTLRTWTRTLPFELEVRSSGEMQTQIGEAMRPGDDPLLRKQLRALVNMPSYRDGVLSGRFAGTIPTPDVDWVSHTVAFDLRLVNGVLRGQASAQTGIDPLFFSVASYLELRKR